MLAAHIAHAPAGTAGLVDDLAGALALRTGGGGLGIAKGGALGGADGAAALAVRADLRRGARLAAAALAVGALLHPGHGDVLLAAEGGLLKAYVHGGADAITLAGGVGVSGAAAAKAEDIAEDIAKAAEVVKTAEVARAEAARAEAGVGVKGRVAVLVVLGALVVIR